MALAAAEPIAFLATARPEVARTFYRDVLGLTLLEEDEFALVFAVGSVALRLVKVSAVQPAERTLLGWQVADAHATAEALRAAGVVFERYSGLDQDVGGLWRSPGGALVAWFRDPDGNLLSITQPAGER